MPYVPLPTKKRKKRKQPQKKTPHQLLSRRLTLLGVMFLVVCLVYSSILIALQAQGNAYAVYKEPELPSGATTKIVTLQAVRGEIYDRNGKALVTNHYSYDLVVEYDSLTTSLSIPERNALFLKLIDQLSDASAGQLCIASDLLVGSYPELSFAKGLTARRKTLLKNIALREDAGADEVVAYYVRRYALDAHEDGIPRYTNEQIQSLILLYADMDASSFGAGTQEYTLATSVSAELIAAYKETSSPGLRFVMQSERVYHYPGYASHILGRISPIFAEDWEYYNSLGYPMNAAVGVSGAESAFEHLLHGTDGKIKVTLDQEGRPLSSEVIQEPISGRDIRLTIDIDLQIAAEDALRDQLNAEGSLTSRGAVVVTDPDSGECLALVSAPTYDLSVFDQTFEDINADPDFPMFNRALSGTYAPGKLLHLSSAIAGLGDSVLSTSTYWQDTGVLQTKDDAVLCPLIYTHTTGHGYLNLSTALSDGCDVFFGRVGITMGTARLSYYEALLGLGQKTGMELSEAAGLASTPKSTGDTDAMKMANGDAGAQTTPIQLCSLLSTVLSGGHRYRSHLLYQVRNFTTGEVMSQTQKEVLATLPMYAAHQQYLMQAMMGVAKANASLSPLAHQLAEKGIGAGAMFAVTPSGSAKPNHAIALAFGVPLVNVAGENRSSIAICVVLEHGLYSDACAPVIASILDHYYAD